MPKLERLYLYNNQLVRVSLSGMPALERLDLHNNQLARVSLSDMPALEYLNLGNNRIMNIGFLVSFAWLGRGDSVLLEDNPLDRESVCEHFETLWRRGVSIGYNGPSCY